MWSTPKCCPRHISGGTAQEEHKGRCSLGGPESVYSEDAPNVDERILHSGIPILGICYGMQLMAKTLGGEVRPAERHEYGKAVVSIDAGSPIFNGLDDELTAWMSHGDLVESPPEGFAVIGRTENTPVAAMADDRGKRMECNSIRKSPHTRASIRPTSSSLLWLLSRGPLCRQ